MNKLIAVFVMGSLGTISWLTCDKVNHKNIELLDLICAQEPAIVFRINTTLKEINKTQKDLSVVSPDNKIIINKDNKIVENRMVLDNKDNQLLLINESHKNLLANYKNKNEVPLTMINEISKHTKDIIQVYLDKIVSPIEQILNEQRSRKAFIEPIIDEVITSKQSSKADVFLKKFLTPGSSDEIKSFCSKQIKDINDLEKFCKELSVLLEGIKDSFSAQTKKNYESFLIKLKKQQKS